MHKELLVASIKASGKVLRELHDVVLLPFGTEYSIFIKNLSAQRCEFKIHIDGNNIAEDNSSFIVNGNQSIEIERFLGQDKNTGYKFKFIERTESIENHRGIGAEDGLVQIEYEFERITPPITNAWTPQYDPWHGTKDMFFRDREIYCSAKLSTADDGVNSRRISATSAQTMDSFFSTHSSVNDAGITTQGSFSNQKFQTVAGIVGTGIKHTMVLKLKGEIQSQPVIQPFTTKMKLECNMCGKLNKGLAKYCVECGTNLQMLV